MSKHVVAAVVIPVLVLAGLILLVATEPTSQPRAVVPPPPTVIGSPGSTPGAHASTTSSISLAFTTVQSRLPLPKFQDKVLFLKGGEVWVAADDGSNPMQLTDTSGTVYFYSVSPGLSYLEYQTLEKSADRRTDINVLDLNSGQIVKTLTNTQSIFHSFMGDQLVGSGAWLSDSLLYVRDLAGPVARDNFRHPFVVDIQGTSTTPYHLPPIPLSTKSGTAIDLRVYSLITNGMSVASATSASVIQLEGNRILYEREGALYGPSMGSEGNEGGRLKEFHVLDTATGKDRLIATISENLEGATLNHGGNTIALTGLGFEQRLGLNPGLPDQPYKVLIYPSNLLYGSNSYESDLRWSFDDKFLGFRNAGKGDGMGVVLVEISNPTNQKFTDNVEGPDGVRDFPLIADFQWTRHNGIIFQRGNNIYLYKPETDATILFSASSSYPFVF